MMSVPNYLRNSSTNHTNQLRSSKVKIRTSVSGAPQNRSVEHSRLGFGSKIHQDQSVDRYGVNDSKGSIRNSVQLGSSNILKNFKFQLNN